MMFYSLVRLILIAVISIAVWVEHSAAQQMFRYIGAPSLDCNGTYPQVYFDNAVEGRPLKITVLGHPRQPGPKDASPSHPGYAGAKVMLVGTIVTANGSNINAQGIDLGAGLRYYATSLSGTEMSEVAELNHNGVWQKTIPLPLGSAGKELLVQAIALAPTGSNEQFPARHCATDQFSASPGSIIRIQPAGLNGATVTNSSTFTSGGITLTLDASYPQGTLATGEKYIIAPNGVRVIGSSHPSSNHEVLQQLIGIRQATGGTFTLTYNGQTTAPIPVAATGAEVKARLEALSNINLVTVLDQHVSGNHFYYWAVTLNDTTSPPTLMSANTSGLTVDPQYSWYHPAAVIRGRLRNGGTFRFEDNGLNPFDNGEPEISVADLGVSYADNMLADISPSRSLHVPAGETLLVCRSRTEVLSAANGGTPNLSRCLDYLYMPVTANGLREGSFAPPYAGIAKPIFNISAIDESLLRNLAPPATDMLTQAQALENSRIDGPNVHGGGTFYRRVITNQNYGRNYSAAINDAFLWLHLNVPIAQKRPVLYNLVQNAINQWGLSNTNRLSRLNTYNNLYHDGLSQNGGHQQGNASIALIGAILRDPMKDMYKNLKNYGEKPIYFYVNSSHTQYGYPSSMIGRPEWRMSMEQDPNPSLTAISYRICCSANALQTSVLVARIMNLEHLFANQAIFDYLERYNTEIAANTGWTQFWSPFTEAVYQRHNGGL